MMPICGYLAEEYGWRMVFYVTGSIGVLWYISWLLIVKESPFVDPHISQEEKRYILESLGHTDTTQPMKRAPIPWKSILTSSAVWAIAAANFSENWGFYTLLTQLPTFLKDTLDLKLNGSGFISGLPYFAMALMLIPSGYLADWTQKKGYLTTTQVRRYFNCGGFLSQTTFMMLAAYLAHPIYSIISLVVAVGLGAFSISGYAVNHLDIAPQYAGLLMGISNTFGTIPGIVSPLITGFIVQNRVSYYFFLILTVGGMKRLAPVIKFWG